MTPKTEKRLRQLAEHFYLQIEPVGDLPDKVPGFLEPGSHPRYIFVNARMPACDQALTILHEIAHYVLHLDRPPRSFLPVSLNFVWQAERMQGVTRATNRWMRRHFNEERQADFWAFIMLWQIGAVAELLALHQRYPEKSRLFWAACAATIYGVFVRRIKNLFTFGR